jgi:hypothetical protein
MDSIFSPVPLAPRRIRNPGRSLRASSRKWRGSEEAGEIPADIKAAGYRSARSQASYNHSVVLEADAGQKRVMKVYSLNDR